ncbi:MAG: hypothetical protein AB1427_02685 [Thermodesulfobacteriota bacterium]
MKSIQRVVKFMGILTIGLVLLAGCASTTYINVDYKLPDAPTQLKGQTVFLDYQDARAEKVFLSPAAQAEFKYFTGIFSLTLTGPQRDNLVGSFDAASLFKEAFKRRLGTMGVEVASVRTDKQPVMEIIVKDFFLDLKDRKWMARINFETRLTGDPGRVATQTVSGAAERLKTIGRRDAETVLGEIFTDAVNNVKISELFQKVGF